MAALEYPRDKLQVLLLLEADDDVTIEAAQARAESEVDHDRAGAAGRPAHQTQGAATTGCTSPPARSSPSTTPRTCPSRCSCAGWSRRSADCPTTSPACRRKLAYPQRPPEPAHRLVHRRVRACGSAICCPADAQHLADPVGRHVESPAPRRAGRDRRLGSVQRHRGRRPRTAHRRDGLPHRASSTRPRWRRPTATRSTGSGSGPVGTRATCRPGWCTSAHPVKLFRTLGFAQLRPVQPGAGGHPDHRGAQPGVLVDHGAVVPRPARRGRCGVPAGHLLSGAGLR